MPKGPKRRGADVSEAAGRLAAGKTTQKAVLQSAAAELGSKGGKARAASLSQARRKAIAKKAAAKRWKRPAPE